MKLQKAMSLSKFFLSAAVSTTTAQSISPPAASAFSNATGYAGVPVRYKEVPTGVCELDPNVKRYSGYADVSENQNIFFWTGRSKRSPLDGMDQWRAGE